MNQRREVVRVDEIEPITFPSGESHASLIEPDGVGSTALTVSQYILAPHTANGGGVHPENDEAYYVLRGKARVLLGGSLEAGDGSGRWYDLEPDMAVFIPAGTFHHLENDGDEEFVILTICPQLPRPNSGLVNELKKKEWGTTFRLRATTA